MVELNRAGADVGVANGAEARTGVSSGAGVEPLTAGGGLTGVPLTEAGLLPTLLFFLFFECLRIEVRSKCCRRNSALLSSLLTSAALLKLLLAMPVEKKGENLITIHIFSNKTFKGDLVNILVKERLQL